MLVSLHALAYLLFGSSLFLSFEVLAPRVEVTALATLCLHENQRFVRMCGADDIYELVEILMDQLS